MASNGLIMPEVLLYDTLNGIMKLIKEDWVNNPKEETMLSHFFNKDENERLIKWETFNFFTQAEELFINQSVQVFLGYNMEVAKTGCIHILLPSETGNPLNIGADEGANDPEISTDDMANEYYQGRYTKRFNATYQLMITSENTFEVILIYNFLKACFISLNAHLELAGIRDIKIGGADVNLDSSQIPTHIFHRAFTVSFWYDVSVPSIFRKRLIKTFASTGIISVKN